MPKLGTMLDDGFTMVDRMVDGSRWIVLNDQQWLSHYCGIFWHQGVLAGDSSHAISASEISGVSDVNSRSTPPRSR